MTLIFSHRSPVTGLFTLSDTVVSTQTRGTPIAIELPFRDGSVSHDAQGYSIAALRQKTTIAKRTLLMWANLGIVARALFQHILAKSDNGERRIDLREALATSGLSEHELSQASLIYHFCSGSNEIVIESWNCEALHEEGAHDLVGTGSGVGYFFESLSLKGDAGPTYETVLKAFHTKIVSHAILEGLGTASLDHLYGGWFEIAYKTAESFKKVPYAIKRWARHDGVLASGGPTLFGWYSGENLIVTRHQPHERNGVLAHDLRHFFVPDFLGRAGAFSPPSEAIRPYFIAHIVHDEDEKKHLVYLETDPQQDEMIVEAGPHGFRIAWSNKLRERLLCLTGTADGLTLSDAPA